MGEEIKRSNDEVDGKVDKPAGGTGGKTNGNSASSTSSRTGGTGGNGDGGRTGGTGTAETEKAISGLVTVEVPKSEEERKKEERNAKRRERYRKQKEQNGGQVKPRKVNSKKQTQQTIDTTQINALIMSVSSVVASRPNCEQWLLTEPEVDSITKPLMAMLEESEAITAIANNSNQIALAVACISVFAPRIMVTVHKVKEEKERERIAKQPKIDTTKGSVKVADRRNDKNPSTNGTGNSDVIPFYGSPIS